MTVIEVDRNILQTNRFVNGFLIPAQADLESLYEVEEDIAAERMQWQRSGAVEQLVDSFIQLCDIHNIKHTYDYPKVRKNLVDSLAFHIYAEPETSQKDTSFLERQILAGFPYSTRRILDRASEEQLEHRSVYRQAIRQLSEQKRDITKVLLDRWQPYMVGDVSSFEELGKFLSDEEFVMLRDQHKIFLQALQARSQQSDFLGAIKSKVLEEAVIHPSQDWFSNFIEFMQGEPNRDSNLNLLQWLRLLSYPSAEVDPELVLQKIKQAGILPRDLKGVLESFLDRSLTKDVLRIKELLAPYRPQRLPSIQFAIKRSVSKRKGYRLQNWETDTITSGAIKVSEQRPSYRLTLHGQDSIGQEERDRYIIKTANGFAEGDIRMREDIRNIVDSLEEDPFRLGVAKLTNSQISVDGRRRVPLRRYSPDKIKLEHEESWRLRAVYYIDRRANPDTIFLFEILHHKEFDKKYK